ncbi:MAG: biopolymer transporter ExbD [Verrucomicrobiales bacterium]|nr:biopolymer transporter ExbD [Verrucomicrobiales bacterium]
MPRRTSSPFAKHEEPDFNVSALIDVAFLLLIYFIITSTLSRREADLSMAVPGISDSTGSSVQMDQMRIDVSASGTIVVNGEPLEAGPEQRNLPDLVDRLTRYAAMARIAQSEPVVIVNCSGEVTEQRFIDVLNACHIAGISNLGITQ